MEQSLERSHERQYNLDLLKALAIVCMVLCHPVIMFAQNRVGYQDEFGHFFADIIIGSYLVAAHGFMFAMGVGMAYSRNNSPKALIHRGVKLFILAYVLNFVRFGMYYMTLDIINGSITEMTLQPLFGPDILQFAGLAFIATGIFRKLEIKDSFILYIGLILSVIGTVTAFTVDTDHPVLNMIIGLFIFTVTPSHASSFCFLSWYLFVAVGILFGRILQEAPDKDAFYKRLMIASGIITAIYIAFTCFFGVFFLSLKRAFYVASPIEAAGLLSIDFFVLSLFYFLLKKVPVSKFRIPIEMSRNINSIYAIHWSIIGLTFFVFCFLLNMVFGYVFMYVYGIILLVVSFLLARFYKSLKAKYQENHHI